MQGLFVWIYLETEKIGKKKVNEEEEKELKATGADMKRGWAGIQEMKEPR